MRAFVFAMILAIGCSGDPSPVAEEETAEEAEEPDPDCVPMSCSELGAQCGSVDNGCGVLIDCGGCDDGVCGDGNQCETDGACVPQTCAGVGAECGLIDDGCGGTVECDGCAASPGAVCSDDNQCVFASCGGEGTNECGSCGELPVEPGEPCACDGTAECTIYGLQCSDGDGFAFDPVGDSDPSTFIASGAMDLSLQRWDYDEFTISVEDETWSRLEPSFTISHPGGYELNVCVIMDGHEGPIESFCADGGTNFVENGVRRGCCMTLDSAGDARIALDFPFAPFTDYSADYTIQVRGVRDEELGPTISCDSYVVAFGF